MKGTFVPPGGPEKARCQLFPVRVSHCMRVALSSGRTFNITQPYGRA